MAIPTVSAFTAVSLLANVAGASTNLPVPIYAIVASDTFIPLAIPSSWGEFSFTYDSAISDYPQEQGAFSPYNKVVRPQTIRVTLIKGGSDLERFGWLAAIQQAEANNPEQLYTIVSPEGIYVDFTIAKMSYSKRTEKGSHLLYLDIDFLQVPIISYASTGTWTDVLASKSGPVANVGRVFTNAITASQSALVNAATFLTT